MTKSKDIAPNKDVFISFKPFINIDNIGIFGDAALIISVQPDTDDECM